MQLSTWLIYSSLALVSVISPGPAVLLSVTNSIRNGLSKSIFSSLGNITGILMVSGAAALGLGVALQASTLLFTILKISGAIYLIYLGIRQWWAKRIFLETTDRVSESSQSKRKSFVQGILVAISNPKAILFFTALFPQFLDVSRPIAIQFIILTSTFMLFSFLVLVCYAQSAHSFKGWLAKGKRALWFNRISGTIYIAFGLGILRLKNRSA